MIKIEWDNLRLFLSEAANKYTELKSADNVTSKLQDLRKEEYNDLHDKLKELWENSKAKGEDVYSRDLYFALELFEFFTQQGFSQWEAADNEIWAGLTFYVAPDIYYDRWPWSEEDHAQRWIFKRNWRVWLKTLWWWVFLAMATDENGNFDKEKTREQLEIYETTSIETLLDRCGCGFRVEFCRKLIKRHYEYCKENHISGTERRSSLKFVVMQSFLRAKNIDPDLCGYDTFLDGIFDLLINIKKQKEGLA